MPRPDGKTVTGRKLDSSDTLVRELGAWMHPDPSNADEAYERNGFVTAFLPLPGLWHHHNRPLTQV